jgi:hypothetical protein
MYNLSCSARREIVVYVLIVGGGTILSSALVMAEVGCWYHQLPRDIVRRLSSILEEQGFNLRSSTCEITSVSASLWVSSLYRLKVTDNTKTMSLYIKCLPSNLQRRYIFDSHLQFRNETIFYNKVFTEFVQFGKEKLSQDSYDPIGIPKCYAAESDEENAVLVMEDLSSAGFVVLSRLKVMGLHELLLVMRELGRFHAFSLAMKNQDPDRFSKLKGSVSETAFSNSLYNKLTRDLVTFILIDVLEMLKAHYPQSNSYLNKYERFVGDAEDRIMKLLYEDSTNGAYNVINHGDLWVNNLMFHYPPGPSSKEPDGMRFLDFQQTRYTSPAMDIGRLLFVGTDRTTREVHRQELLRCYHDSLGETVRHLGSDVEQLLPFSALEPQLKHCAPLIIANALLNLPHALDEWEGSDDEVAGDDSEAIKSAIRAAHWRMTPSCKRRIIEIIEESVDRGYIN